jgi:hypothetical protein
MSVAKWMAVAALGCLVLASVSAAEAAAKRPRPTDVPRAETSIAPDDFQVYNDYASPGRMYSSRGAVVHYVAFGIDAPPLNDDDADGVPDYVERVGDAADRALAYYELRGFRTVVPDAAGPDARPDVYISRFSPGTLGIAFPSSRAQGGAFAVVSNNLDPSAERSFASVYATVAHELFHLVQFSYFGGDEPALPTWILEGTAAALERRVNPQLDDLVSTIQLRSWFSATERSMTERSYGAQLLWRWLDTEQPRFLPALFTGLATHPAAGEGQRVVASTFFRVTGRPFANALHRFAVSVLTDSDHEIAPARGPVRGVLAPLSVRYIRAALPRTRHSRLSVVFARAHVGDAATLVYRIDSDIAGNPPRMLRVAPRVSEGGRRLVFTVSGGPRRSAVLVLTNGAGRAARYALSARASATA